MQTDKEIEKRFKKKFPLGGAIVYMKEAYLEFCLKELSTYKSSKRIEISEVYAFEAGQKNIIAQLKEVIEGMYKNQGGKPNIVTSKEDEIYNSALSDLLNHELLKD